uniref:Replication protein A 70 kDa DNA-binding subunit B/D first OB fold domain-containing protein n=1 Tax=Tanacetum cinerariifolium TaxID=118510 RepID=A0A6L2L5T7_TANCI|nr:hypothetical protein [Tanacetum cinerariifolium]
MVLIDEEGCKIHASVKKTLVSEFDKKLEQGKCYYLSDFGVTERKANHHVVSHKYQINFYHITKVDNRDDIGGSLFGFDFRPFKSVRSEVKPSTVAYDVIGQVVSCGSLDYPIIEGRPVKQLRFELQDTMGVRLSITLWGPYAEQVDEALGDKTKMSILIMQFAKTQDIQSVVAIVGMETPEHPIAPLVMSCVVVGTIKCVKHERKWYYLGCHACKFGVDPKTEDYKDEESGLVKKKTIGYICKNKSCGEVSDVLYKFKIQIRVLDNTRSVSLTLFDCIANALLNKDDNELVEKQLKRKLEDVIDVEELSNASSIKKKLLAPKIEKD